ncbi:putative porin, partial [Acinetobacter baumannii]
NVDTAKGPLAEAAFLNQASSVSLGYSYQQYDQNNVNYHIGTYGVKGEAYVPTPYLPVYASATYNHTDVDGKNNFSKDDNGDRYALEVGAMLLPNFLMTVGYTSVANQFALDNFGIIGNGIYSAVNQTAAIQNDQDAVTARAKYVGPIDGTNMAIGFEAAGAFGQENQYGLKTDLYLTPKLSVGATFVGNDGEADIKGNDLGEFRQAWGGNVNYFITPALAVGASYMKADVKKSSYDTQTIGLNAKFRF